MRVRTLEIRWHDNKPISTSDFQPVPFKKARPAQEKHFATQSYRLATEVGPFIHGKRSSQLEAVLAKANADVELNYLKIEKTDIQKVTINTIQRYFPRLTLPS